MRWIRSIASRWQGAPSGTRANVASGTRANVASGTASFYLPTWLYTSNNERVLDSTGKRFRVRS